MIGRLNHVAIVVPDLAAASAIYRDALGAKVTEPEPVPDHGVTTVFIELDNTKIELLHPLGDDSLSLVFSQRIHRVACITCVMKSRTSWLRGTGWSPKGRECSAQGNRVSERTASLCCSYTLKISVGRWLNSSKCNLLEV